MKDCELCREAGGRLLWRDGFCRVVAVDEPGLPGFLRVILERHEREMTDLGEAERVRLMNVVFAVERHVRRALQPDKVNLASLGNLAPHLHWHVIARWQDDRYFPRPIWAAPLHQDPVPAARAAAAAEMLRTLGEALGRQGAPRSLTDDGSSSVP